MLKAEYLMREQGKTQTDVSNETGIERVTINRVLRGTLPPYPKYHDAFAKALDWQGNPAELFEPIEVV